MRRLVPGGTDFFDQALRFTGFVDVTGVAAKFAGVGIANTGIVSPQGRYLGRVDTVYLFTAVAQEVQVFQVRHSITADGGAVTGTLAPADPRFLLLAQGLPPFATVKFTDSSTVATDVQIAQFGLLAGQYTPWTIPQDLSNLTSLLFVAVTAATRLVGIFSVRARHLRNAALLASGG